jgi:hypothetical protein
MCLNAGKLDGLCEEWQSPQPGGESDPDESRAAVSKTVDLYFQLYIEILAKQGAGTPRPEALRQIDAILGWPSRAVDTKGPKRPAVVKRRPLIDMLNNALERVLGFDFNISPVQEFGKIRHVPDRERAIALIKATRASFILAIDRRSRAAVREPLTKFWTSFPGYRPMHGPLLHCGGPLRIIAAILDPTIASTCLAAPSGHQNTRPKRWVQAQKKGGHLWFPFSSNLNYRLLFAWWGPV